MTLRSLVKAHVENPCPAPASVPAQLQRYLTQPLAIRVPINTSSLTPAFKPVQQPDAPSIHLQWWWQNTGLSAAVTTPVQGFINLKKKSVLLHLYSCFSNNLFFLRLSFQVLTPGSLVAIWFGFCRINGKILRASELPMKLTSGK